MTHPHLPPIIEVAISVQFEPLELMTSAHMGVFWNSLGPLWSEIQEQGELNDQFETFDDDLSMGKAVKHFFRIGNSPYPGRLIIGNPVQLLVLQIQRSRFVLNWRGDSDNYEGFSDLQRNFRDFFNGI